MRRTVLVLLILTAAVLAEPVADEIGSGRMQVLGEEGVVGELPLEHTSV
ncbi:MAG: hypothetical protein GF388_00240, partial [Candidatus Aegiribacteria sp.]|nr:hypothetical protein [Candidatus Aegiribacteria sp.]MBD3293883.1 hypothetical protein [Candidatus Fermentibacteria bacterium]